MEKPTIEQLDRALRSLAKTVVLNQIDMNAFRASYRADVNLDQFAGNYAIQRERLEPLLKIIDEGSLVDLLQEIERVRPKN